MARYLEGQKNITASLPNEKYSFSYSFASKELIKHGIWKAKVEKSEPETMSDMSGSKPFSITAFTAGATYDTRSIQIEKNVNAHLKAFLKANAFTRSNAVISQVIAAGLEVYGEDLTNPIND
ncbi:MAG: hypothetical protein J6M27_05675 [Lachnospiraceae bacterium]|nr:hypothetical protein [Lachnospiraceae bacterium]